MKNTRLDINKRVSDLHATVARISNNAALRLYIYKYVFPQIPERVTVTFTGTGMELHVPVLVIHNNINTVRMTYEK